MTREHNRESSANYLRFFPSEETSQALLSSLADEERVATASIKTLSLHKDERVIPAGRDALFRIQHPPLLRNSIEAYLLIGTTEAIEVIVERLSVEEGQDWKITLEKYQDKLDK